MQSAPKGHPCRFVGLRLARHKLIKAFVVYTPALSTFSRNMWSLQIIVDHIHQYFPVQGRFYVEAGAVAPKMSSLTGFEVSMPYKLLQGWLCRELCGMARIFLTG